MSKEIALRELTNEQIELVKRTVAVGATNDELALFLYTAKRTGLDPLTKQIHFVKRAGRGTIQTGIDGYRAIAERTGKLAGIEDATYEGERQYGGKKAPDKASVKVQKLVEGNIVPFTASARWDEYCPGPPNDFMWKKMPFLMLAKCAESLALRKAFPNDLSGLYTTEEMDQAGSGAESKAMEPYVVKRNVAAEDDDEQSEPVHVVDAETTETQKNEIKTLLEDLGKVPKSLAEGKRTILSMTGLEFIETNYPAIIAKLKAMSPIETLTQD